VVNPVNVFSAAAVHFSAGPVCKSVCLARWCARAAALEMIFVMSAGVKK
jgi:hypothetical protein